MVLYVLGLFGGVCGGGEYFAEGWCQGFVPV